MAISTRNRTYSTLVINDFSGGWNPRDAWSEIGDNELPDMMNMTLDEQGGAVKRLGLVRANAVQINNTGNIQSLYYSSAIDKTIAQIGASLYVSADGGTTWGASIKTFSTAARVHMVDFLGKVILIHPVDKCFTYDGTTVSAVIANSPPGTCIAVWQNALWSIGDPAQPSRVTRSDLGGPTWTATPITVDLRAKDDQPLTAIGGGQGMDILGRDGIFVFKENSTYRINTAASGANTVEDYSYGASGPEAIATNGGVTVAISRKGVIGIQGTSAPVFVSAKIDPLFKPNQINFAQAGKMVAVNYGNDRILFSIPFGGANANSLSLEFAPRAGWFAPHNFGISSGTNYLKNTRQIIGGKVGSAAASYGFVYDVFVGGKDDGAPISSRIQTRWYETNNGSDVRYRRAVVNGRGSFTMYVKRNYDTGVGEAYPVAITGELPLWGAATWGEDTWSSQLQQDYVEVFSLGHGRSISLEIQETSSLTSEGVKLLDVGDEPELGSFAIYGISVDMVGLGNS